MYPRGTYLMFIDNIVCIQCHHTWNNRYYISLIHAYTLQNLIKRDLPLKICLFHSIAYV